MFLFGSNIYTKIGSEYEYSNYKTIHPGNIDMVLTSPDYSTLVSGQNLESNLPVLMTGSYYKVWSFGSFQMDYSADQPIQAFTVTISTIFRDQCKLVDGTPTSDCLVASLNFFENIGTLNFYLSQVRPLIFTALTLLVGI